MISFNQSSFRGGIRQDLDATKVAQLGDSYFLGVNIRTSQDAIDTIRKHEDLSDTIPSGKLQGIYGANTNILLFIDGYPYVKDFRYPETSFIRLTNIQGDRNADYIYAEFVPGSTIGYGRSLITTPSGDGASQIEGDTVSLNRELPFNSSIQGLIYQDGISRPKLLTDDGQVRALNDYAAWNLEDREYVPLGTFMHWSAGGILYLVDANKSQIFHSVSGRPLDFVIPVTQEGDKVDQSEEEGGGPATAIKIDYEPITGFRSVPAENSYVATTAKRTFLVTELLGEFDLRFDEPTYSVFPVAAVGAVNWLSFGDLNGDTGIINPNGIHSLNASKILKTESGNDPVSAPIAGLFKYDEDLRVTQDYPCAKEFGADYTLFSINTIYGRGTLVYDRNVSKFVSLDMQDDLAQIKQYADIIVNGERRLFFITTDNKFYEAWASDEIAPAKLTIGEWCSNDPRIEQSPLFLHAVFTECEQEGTVTVTPIVNRVHYSPKTETLKALATPKTLPISTPFGGGTRNTTQVVTFNLSGTVSAGWKLGFEISWNVKARLTHVSLDAEQNKQDTNSQAKARRYAAGAS